MSAEGTSEGTATATREILRRALIEIKGAHARLADAERALSEPVAVVGMGCRFPGGVNGVEDFWELLLEEREAVAEVPADRWDVEAYFDEDPDAPGKTYTRHGAFVDGVDTFDAGFFGIPPREAASMDPQHRLVLEVAWTALEHAAIAPDSLRDTATGVFIGIASGDYAHVAMKTGDPTRIDAYVSTGNAANFAGGRLSYLLGLRGPSLVIDTACSSSLVSVHLACQSLRAGECGLALAGGVSLQLLPETTIALAKGRMLSPEGRCRTFDARADGYVRGEGCGIVVLKRLSDALTDSDQIWAVIRGSAVNQDGRSSAVTVPYAAAQEDVIRRALALARILPEEVGYVEAHGTGTPLGDPIELRALARALASDREHPLLVGSVKTNIGHLEAAAGVAGLMKAVLAVNRGEIPAHLHFERPTPHVDWEKLALAVPTTSRRFPDGPRVAGVSSFGISGTNAHVIVSAPPDGHAPTPPDDVDDGVPQLVKIAAHGNPGLVAAAARLEEFVRNVPQAPLPEIAHLANVGRADLPDRAVVVATTRGELAAGLRAVAEGDRALRTAQGRAPAVRPRIAFLVPGQGSQLAGAGRDLYTREPACRLMLDELAEVMGPLDQLPLSALLEPGPASERALRGTDVAQPALYALALTLGAWWKAVGVRPDALLGHSAGAYAAAALAGVLSFRDGARLIRERGRMMAKLPAEGAMAAVMATPERLRAHLEHHPDLAIAALNAPGETVVSGPADTTAELLRELAARDVRAEMLPVAHAFHSAQMDPVLESLAAELASTPLHAAAVPLVSDATGELAGPDIATARYWIRHARHTLHFTRALETLQELGCDLLIELGPSGTLLGLASRTLPQRSYMGLRSLHPGHSSQEQLRVSLAHAYCQGAPVAWRAITRPASRPWPLPTYPFQRRRHWIPTAVTPLAPRRRPQADLMPRPIPIPLPHDLFTAELDVDRAPVLSEHRVHGHPVVPGVLYIHLVLTAAEQMGNSDPVITCLTLHNPLIVPRGRACTTYVLFEPPDDSGSRKASLYSYPPQEAPSWTLHAVADVIASGPHRATAAALSVDEIRARCPQEHSGSEFYERVWHPEFALGPSFRLIERVFRGEREALAFLRAPAEATGGMDVRPELMILDACVQALMAALPDSEFADGTQRHLTLGTGYRRFTTHRSIMPSRLWCWAILRDSTPEEITGDLRVLDEEGRPVADVGGVQFRRVGAETVRRLASVAQSAHENSGPLRPDERVPVREQLVSAAPNDRDRLIAEYLADEVGAVLGLPAAEVELQDSIVAIADSLMLAELKSRLEADLDLEVPLEALFQQPNLRDLAGWLSNRLGDSGHGWLGDGPVAGELVEHIVAEVEELSDADALRQLAAERRKRHADG